MQLTTSVALCTYNGARYLGAQLASILAQHQLPNELIISDDGSTDDTRRVVSEWLPQAEDSGIRVTLSSEGRRLGVTANFARAIAACGSDLVVLSDQDDVWHRDRVQRVVAAFESNPALLLQHTDARLIDAVGDPLGLTLFGALGVTAADRARINHGDAFAVYLRRNIATGATVSFRRRLFDIAAPLPDEWVHDEWLAIIAAATGSVEVSAESVIDYRQHGANEIGAQAPTLRYKFSRLLATAPNRNDILARRSRILADRLESMEGVSVVTRDRAAGKARFESERARLSVSRIGRLGTIWRASRDGGYATYASQGRLDIVRDLLQARGVTRGESSMSG